MKIIQEPTPNAANILPTTRASWIEAVRASMNPSPKEIPTGYRDRGQTVRFQFHTGAIAEWPWCARDENGDLQTLNPETVVREATAGKLLCL